jgi:hypothetical protein
MGGIPQQLIRIQLYIDVGDKEQNEAIFDVFAAEREAIEGEFGEPLVWGRREDVRMSSISLKRPGSIEGPPDKLEELKVWGAARLLKIRQVFGPRAKALVLPLPIEPEPDNQGRRTRSCGRPWSS